jgi:hypothetical protein
MTNMRTAPASGLPPASRSLPRGGGLRLSGLESDGPRLHAMPPPRRTVDYGAAVYGSVLVAALVAAEFESDVDARAMTLTVFATTIVFWLAHVWSDALGERVAGAAITLRRLRGIAVARWPLVEAGFVPAALLALSWIGVYSRGTGVAAALAAAVLQLLSWGFLAAWRTGQRLAVRLLSSVVNGALGGAIVVLEVLVLH